MLKFLFPLVLVLSPVFGASIRRSKGLVPHLDGRIVGGYPTTVDRYPHQISLNHVGYHRCGGSILSINVILTAAHCTVGIPPADLRVFAGITDISVDKGLRRQVISKVEHEEFGPSQYLNDVALLWLEEGLVFGRYIGSIKLASHNEKLSSGTMVYVSGWGSTYYGGPAVNQLQVVYMAVVGNKECEEKYDEVNPITDAMMCAGEPFGGKDACQGDSGGPLIVNDKQYGIVSWGVGCALPQYPGVHANVANLRPWIDAKLAANGS